MRNFSTTFKPLVVFAPGSSKQAGAKLKEMGVTKVLACYDKNLYNTGIVEPILKSIEESGLQVVRFDKVEINCPDYSVEECIGLANQEKIDGVLALGGGSTLDTAKATSVLMGYPLPINQYWAHVYKGPALTRKVKVVAIPTTAGTGAEGTRTCVVNDTKSHIKANLVCDQCKPDMVFLDPELQLGIPPYLTAITGIDALAHACEALCCNRRNIYTHMICVKAVEMVWRSLPKAFRKKDDLEARSEMAVAAYLALTGESYGNCGHSMAHAIGAQLHDVPHGHVVSWTYPYALWYTRNDCDEEIRLIANAIGIRNTHKEVARDVSNALLDFAHSFGLKTPKEMGFDREKFVGVLDKVMLDPIKEACDTPLTEKAALELLGMVYDQEPL
jgi:alcohol dehydrogenase class IV